MLKNKLIICFSGTNWQLPWGISQKIMEKLSEFNTVIYIEYQPSFLHCYFRNLSHIKYNIKDRGGFKRIGNNLHIYTPKIGLPFNAYLRAINISNQGKIAKDIESEVDKHDPRNVIFWIFAPYAVDFVKPLGRFFTVYHCAGNYAVEKDNFLRKRTVLAMEKELLGLSDIVIAQTKSLCEKFKRLDKKTFYFPSAVDLVNFSGNTENIKNADLEFSRIKHPRIGIVGYFDDAFYDTNLLQYLLDARKDWSFIFIGPLTRKAKNFDRLQKKPNAFFLGYKKPDEIPACIRQFDIGIIPYKVNPYMREVSPTKFYEYIAGGKGVVSTDLLDIKAYSDVVKVAASNREFLGDMEDLLLQGKEGVIEKRALQIAKENSLDDYLERLSEAIERSIDEKKS